MSARAVVLLRYRSLQIVSDLVGLVKCASEDALERIAAAQGVPDGRARLQELVWDDGCRISSPEAKSLHTALILCATMAEEDPGAFYAATAILLADRLQLGEGSDDLFWHWDGFQKHYRAAPPPMRAALLQGFHEAVSEGLVDLFDPPELPDLATETDATIQGLARRHVPPSHADAQIRIHAALAEPGPPEKTWRDVCDPLLADRSALPDPLLRAIRHLFETRPGWSPYDGKRFPLYGRAPPLIPLA